MTSTIPVVPQLSLTARPTAAPTAAATVATTVAVAAQQAASAQPSPVPTAASASPTPPLLDVALLSLTLDDAAFDGAASRFTAAGGTATGAASALPFAAAVVAFSLQLSESAAALEPASCALLQLQLAPVAVAALGLRLDVAPLCVRVAAAGGGLLGDAFCTADGDLRQLDALLDVALGVVNVALRQQTAAAAFVGCSGACDVLSLRVGPARLRLLGLDVAVDSCGGDAVDVCVSATAAEGLVGALLCDLATGALPAPHLATHL